jgi:hypothetical protein
VRRAVGIDSSPSTWAKPSKVVPRRDRAVPAEQEPPAAESKGLGTLSPSSATAEAKRAEMADLPPDSDWALTLDARATKYQPRASGS